MPYETLKVLKENGLRLLPVGFETGSQQILNNIKKGMRVEWAHGSRRTATSSGSRSTGPSSWDCRARRSETIRETIRFVKAINPHTIQVSLPAPLPGT